VTESYTPPPHAEHAGRERLILEVKRASVPFLLFVGLLVAGVLTGANVVRNLAGDKPWLDYKTYRVAFSDTKGIVPGRVELRLAGVKAGSITNSSLVDGQAVVSLHLEKRYAPLYRDARIRIRPVTPLEDMYVDVESRGHPRAGEVKGDEIIPAARTISPVEIGTVLDVFDKSTRADTAQLLTQLGRGLKDNGRNLRWAFVQLAPFLRSAGTLTHALAERRDNLARLIHNFGGIAGELAQHVRQLATFVQSADGTLGQLAHDDAPLRGTLEQLPPTLRLMQQSFANLRQTEGTLDPALRALQPVADSLPKGLDSLSKFSVSARPALAALRPAARELRPLARSLRPTARSLSSAFRALKPEAPQIETFTRKTVPCLPDAGLLLSRAMSFTKFGDSNSNPNAKGANVADARADVRVDITTAGDVGRTPEWKISTPCNRKGGSR
jgi:virulence factor Mce-like protein